MYAYHLEKLLAGHNWQAHHYLEFINVPALSVGLYRLPAGATDPQQPHTEDEIYYIISGQAKILVESEAREVTPGSIIYVPAHQKHSFFDISEDLTILVFFSPAEYSQR
ncbi:MAG: cupin domain-containing protein [Anaerolineales bacterium]